MRLSWTRTRGDSEPNTPAETSSPSLPPAPIRRIVRCRAVPQGDFTNDLWERTQLYALGGIGKTNTDAVPTPPCRQQGTVGSIGGPPNKQTNYPHVNASG